MAFDSSGDLFVANFVAGAPGSSTIYEFTPGGSRSTFATGFNEPACLAFDSSGDLFVTDYNYGPDPATIDEITPSGGKSTFASGLNGPVGLAFDGSGNLFEADKGSGNIYEFTPGGSQSTFATGLGAPECLAFAPTPTPEPSTFVLLVIGAAGLVGYGWRRRKQNRALSLATKPTILRR